MKKIINIGDFKNIAIIQTAFLGDVALCLYLAQSIKLINPDCQLTFITTPSSANFVLCAKAVDNVITYDKHGLQSGWAGIKKIVHQIDEKNIECIIAPHRSLRTSLISFFSKAKFTVGFDKNALSFLYTRRIKYIMGDHEVLRNNSLLSVFSDTFDFKDIINDVELSYSEEDINYIQNKLSSNEIDTNDKLIAIAPGSVWETKKWNKEYYKVVCSNLNKLGYSVVIVGAVADKELGKYLSEEKRIKSFCGETTIPQLIYLLSLCKLIITNDSSPTHFAGLVKCPTLTIYGATVPEFGFSPRGEFDKSVGIDGLKCRPCAIHGGKKCPVKTFDCMNILKPEIVLKNAFEILEQNVKVIQND